MNLKMTLPAFSGFYNTSHTAAIDEEAESLVSRDGGFAMAALNQFYCTRRMMEEYAKAFVERWNEHIQNSLGFDPQIKFDSLWSPREYNFYTDTITVEVPRKTLDRMVSELGPDVWPAVLREHLTPVSGFSPCYPADANAPEWDLEHVDKWQPPQIELLCEAWLISSDISSDDAEQAIIYRMREEGDIHNLVWTHAPEEFKKAVDAISELKTVE